jgi:hypothetical protein
MQTNHEIIANEDKVALDSSHALCFIEVQYKQNEVYEI